MMESRSDPHPALGANNDPVGNGNVSTPFFEDASAIPPPSSTGQREKQDDAQETLATHESSPSGSVNSANHLSWSRFTRSLYGMYLTELFLENRRN